jgi:hypothetical protein
VTVPNPPAGGGLPPQARTTLLTDVRVPEVFTANQETDTRLALTRGLAEYLEPLSIDAVGGRRVRFKAVHEEYAEPEEKAAYPSLACTLAGEGKYEARSLSPVLDVKERLPQPDGRYLIVHCDFVQSISLEAWCTDPAERSAVAIAVERALNPLPSRYGFVLQLPHYFNARAVYSLQSVSYRDDADAASRRLRVAAFTLTATVPYISLFSFPDAKPSFILDTVSDAADVVLTITVS